jgi:hypothetical protein
MPAAGVWFSLKTMSSSLPLFPSPLSFSSFLLLSPASLSLSLLQKNRLSAASVHLVQLVMPSQQLAVFLKPTKSEKWKVKTDQVRKVKSKIRPSQKSEK